MTLHQCCIPDLSCACLLLAQRPGWTLSADKIFTFLRERKADDVIPATELAQQAIEYARELEMIV